MAKVAKASAPAAGTDEADASPKKRFGAKHYAVGGVALVALAAAGSFAVPMALAMSGLSEPPAASSQSTLPAILPAAILAPAEMSAADYRIVSIFEGEAFLATPTNLVRIKVGSFAPGLGDIVSIVASEAGGTVVGSLATLKTS